jgi:hypothetical protein
MQSESSEDQNSRRIKKKELEEQIKELQDENKKMYDATGYGFPFPKKYIDIIDKELTKSKYTVLI